MKTTFFVLLFVGAVANVTQAAGSQPTVDLVDRFEKEKSMAQNLAQEIEKGYVIDGSDSFNGVEVRVCAGRLQTHSSMQTIDNNDLPKMVQNCLDIKNEQAIASVVNSMNAMAAAMHGNLKASKESSCEDTEVALSFFSPTEGDYPSPCVLVIDSDDHTRQFKILGTYGE